jgi:hypothetical protein
MPSFTNYSAAPSVVRFLRGTARGSTHRSTNAALTVARVARTRHLVSVKRDGEARWIVSHGGHLFVWNTSHARFSEAKARHVPNHGKLYADRSWASWYRGRGEHNTAGPRR